MNFRNTVFLIGILFSLSNQILIAQDYYPDTIITKSGDKIKCRITLINHLNIFYKYEKGKSEDQTYISLKGVNDFMLHNNEAVILNKDVDNKAGKKTFKKKPPLIPGKKEEIVSLDWKYDPWYMYFKAGVAVERHYKGNGPLWLGLGTSLAPLIYTAVVHAPKNSKQRTEYLSGYYAVYGGLFLIDFAVALTPVNLDKIPPYYDMQYEMYHHGLIQYPGYHMGFKRYAQRKKYRKMLIGFIIGTAINTVVTVYTVNQ